MMIIFVFKLKLSEDLKTKSKLIQKKLGGLKFYFNKIDNKFLIQVFLIHTFVLFILNLLFDLVLKFIVSTTVKVKHGKNSRLCPGV